MEIKKIEPFRTIRSLYYANRKMPKYHSTCTQITPPNYMPKEPTFGEKLKNTLNLIFRK